MKNNPIFEISNCQVGADILSNRKHTHNDCCELLKINAGHGTILSGAHLYSMEPGMVFFIKTMHVHCTNPIEADKYNRSKLIFNERYFRELSEYAGCGDILERLYNSTAIQGILLSEESAEMYDELMLEAEAKKNKSTSVNTLGISAITLLLLSIVMDNSSAIENQNTLRNIHTENERINNALEYINNNLTETLTIELISQKCNLSKYYLCRRFHEVTGMTIMQYILERRIYLTKEALINTDDSVSNIALNNGFSDCSYYCHIFQKIEHMTPGTFRRQNRLNSKD